jgi:hypothetical protein
VWEAQEARFQDGLRKLQEYSIREGHALVPITYKEPDGFKLGHWVNRYRTRYRKGVLDPEKAELIEGVMGWSWDPLGDDFEEGMGHLRIYREREGHLEVPAKHIEPHGFKLGRWIANRRHQYKEGTLTPARVDALQSVPGWSWDPREDLFWDGLDRLARYASREGHALVPQAYVEPDGFRLGSWVRVRRRDYKDGELSSERISALEAIGGWAWDAVEARFQEGLARLRAFRAREGHARVPQSYTEPNGFKLGLWANTRRVDYRKGKLSPERIAALEAIEGWEW